MNADDRSALNTSTGQILEAAMATLRSARLFAWLAALFAATVSTSYAGPCSNAIDRMQARLDARLEAKAAAGPTASESAAGLQHRQPTPNSIAAAEEKSGALSADKVDAAKQAMARARAADGAGNKEACDQALAEVSSVLGP
jgi:hypothetical protein